MKTKIFIILLIIFTLGFAHGQTKKNTKKTIKNTSVKKTVLKKEVLQEVTAAPVEETAPDTNPLKVKYKRSSLYTIMIVVQAYLMQILLENIL